jgi:DNA-binding transcriptional MocR family regulator
LKHRDPLPNFHLDRASREPLHCQLAATLRRAIRAGDLGPGAPLPSTRALAELLGLSRNTVITAYEELTAEGLLVGRSGSATRVCCGAPLPALPDWRTIVRSSQYPVAPLRFRDSEGNALYFHR